MTPCLAMHRFIMHAYGKSSWRLLTETTRTKCVCANYAYKKICIPWSCPIACSRSRCSYSKLNLFEKSFHSSAIFQKKRKTREEKKFKNIIQYKPKPKFPVIKLWPGITVVELAKKANRTVGDVLEAMNYIENGDLFRKPSSEIFSKEILTEIAKKLGYRVDFAKSYHADSSNKDATGKTKDLYRRSPADPKDLVKRPPVVAIMGHVDHGKTTLLDALRNSSIVSQEHGGITQHIGAFTVNLPEGDITFLDTPGHAAFHAMRARGAQATDMVVLVVAADDSIMEQTVESIRFAEEAKVPIIVAINKIDKPQADIEKVKKDLLSMGIQLEEYGGDVQAVCISALKKLNLSLLTDAILTQAEVMAIASDVNCPVEGVVLETSVDPGKGKLSTALVLRGVLKKSSCIVAGTAWGKVRLLLNEHGKHMAKVTPGFPAQISGWKALPDAGDIILEAESEKHAQEVVQYRKAKEEEEKMAADSIIIKKKLEAHLQKYHEERYERLLKGRHRKGRTAVRDKEYIIDSTPKLSIVLKGDVHGSIEAVLDVMATYKSHDACHLDLVHYGIGHITENDIVLAESFEGLVYGFNVGASPSVKKLAEEKSVSIKIFNVIYHLIDDMKEELSIRLPVNRELEPIGEATVLQVFIINEGKLKVPVAGCRCIKGVLRRGSFCRVIRSDEVIYEGSLITLKHEKTDVETIKENVECGLRIDDPSLVFAPGDSIICLKEKYVPQVTDWNPGF